MMHLVSELLACFYALALVSAALMVDVVEEQY
jgi:hypothetical protein